MKEYNKEVQKLFLEMMLNDAQSFVRVQNIYNVENFDASLQDAATMISEHSLEHGTLPTIEQINAVTHTNLRPVPELNDGHYDWFLDEFEGFTRRQELERAILASADLLEKGEYDPVEKLIKDAVQISLTKDMGTDYFDDPRARLMSIKDNNGQISTGWYMLDKKLYGGFNKGELQIFAGGSGSGKSLFMQNLMVNWVMSNKNCVFITLELSEDLTSMRMDAMMTDTASSRIFKELDSIELKVKMIEKKSGKLRIKYMPAQSTVNDIRSYVKELEIQENTKIDCMCIDYLDLLMPVGTKVSPENLFVKDKYVSEEIRNLAKELDIIMVTASQLNRSAVEEVEFDHSHISGGISKINTADNVFGIFTSRAMREQGRYQLQLMKTRSSAGVGQKIDLEFDLNTLRITDAGVESDVPTAGEVMDNIKPCVTSSNNNLQQSPKVDADIKSAKLQSLLNSIKT
mgnify:CR=1 FL=1|jgi:archaellum biogenesis ATPase FlaH